MGYKKRVGFSTRAVHAGEEPNYSASGDVVVPIHVSSTFARKEVDKPTGGYEYSRTGNPTRDALENKLASLEDAKFGLAFASGLAAESAIALTLLKSRDHVVAFDDLYGGTRRLFGRVLNKNFGIEFTYVDARNVGNIAKAVKPNTKIIWLETPTNPLMKLCDIKAIAEVARERKIITVVDNTFASPYFQKPLNLGADIVVHSATKYLGGHSDVVGGAIMLSDGKLFNGLKFNQNATGSVLGPFESFLVLRGIKTLSLRMERHAENAMKVAEFLEQHKKIKKVYYPGLKSHPQHKLANKQMSGYGGMLSFEINGGLNGAKRFLESVKIFLLAESLGGVESLIEHPALMTHSSVTKDDRIRIGITDSLIRVSVGIENVEDLVEDLQQALAKV